MVLLELAHTQQLKAAAPNQQRTNKLADMLEAAKILEQLAVSDQEQRNTTKPYPNTQRQSPSPQTHLMWFGMQERKPSGWPKTTFPRVLTQYCFIVFATL